MSRCVVTVPERHNRLIIRILTLPLPCVMFYNSDYIEETNFVHQIMYYNLYSSHHFKVFRHSVVQSSRNFNQTVNFR
jgi:hypothetical protein